MNTILIHGSPVTPFYKICVVKEKAIVDTIGVQFEDLDEVIFELIKKYDIKHISFSGAKDYMEGIEKRLKETTVTTYSIDDLTFQYL